MQDVFYFTSCPYMVIKYLFKFSVLWELYDGVFLPDTILLLIIYWSIIIMIVSAHIYIYVCPIMRQSLGNPTKSHRVEFLCQQQPMFPSKRFDIVILNFPLNGNKVRVDARKVRI